MPTGRAISHEPCRCRRRVLVSCRYWGRPFGLRPGMGLPLVASRGAASWMIKSHSGYTSPTTTTKAWRRYVTFSMAGPRGPCLSAL
jgi:hypothetical protein